MLNQAILMTVVKETHRNVEKCGSTNYKYGRRRTEAYGGVWRRMEAYGGVWKRTEACGNAGGLWRQTDSYTNATTATFIKLSNER